MTAAAVLWKDGSPASGWMICRCFTPNEKQMMAFVKEEFFLFEPDFMKEDFLISRHTLPFNPLKDLSEEQIKEKQNAQMPLAFSHTLTEQIGGLIKAGFEITDIYEDCDMNSYVAVRAVKNSMALNLNCDWHCAKP